MDEQHLTETQQLTQQLQQLQGYLQLLEEQAQEVARAIVSIDELQGVRKDTEMYVPLTNGIMVKARMEDASRLLINVGNDVITEHTPEQAKEILQEQQSGLGETQQSLIKQFSELYQRYIQLQLGRERG
ncbi:prefoldin subunit alpha [Candidatus Woesearchaeota archaeon]|nr:prefoldin subunit alpha [Candidatus Woesearchaeota archaeon]